MSKIGLRKLWFQIHKWLGLILAVLIIPLSLSGAALVWDDGLEQLLHPARFDVSGTAAMPPAAYAEAARAALAPGERLSRIEFPEESGEPVVAQASRAGPSRGRPARTIVYLDPADGRVIEKTRSDAGFLRVMHQLHGSLLVPGVGRQVVGSIGVAMLISSLTGLWLWWPVTGSVRRGFRWKRHRNTDTNLHHLGGFWIALPLFVLSLTGAWISFPAFFGPLVGEGARPGSGPDRTAMARAKPLETPATPLAIAIEHVRHGPTGPIRSITWPTDRKPQWTFEVESGGATLPVTVDDVDGSVFMEGDNFGQDPKPTWARAMRSIHDSHGTPFIWQLIVFIGGIIPALLAVTGVIMWTRARSWRARLSQRMAAAAAAAE